MMLNQVVIVGRINDEPLMGKLQDGTSFCKIDLVVQRPYKNEEGVYLSDIIPVMLYSHLCDNVTKYCHKGDLTSIKGRIEIENNDIVLKAEKVTFLSSAGGHNNEDSDTDRSKNEEKLTEYNNQ